MPQHYVADLADLQESGRKIVRIGSTDIALIPLEDGVLAFENWCPHSGGPVGEGTIINKVVARLDDEGLYLGEAFSEDELHIVCPWHGWEYVLPTGECAVDPTRRLRSYPVVVDEGRVLVDLPVGMPE